MLLFPDGRLPSPRWRWMLWAYLAVAAAWVGGAVFISAGAIAGHNVHVDSSGNLLILDNPTGSSAWWGAVVVWRDQRHFGIGSNNFRSPNRSASGQAICWPRERPYLPVLALASLLHGPHLASASRWRRAYGSAAAAAEGPDAARNRLRPPDKSS